MNNRTECSYQSEDLIRNTKAFLKKLESNYFLLGLFKIVMVTLPVNILLLNKEYLKNRLSSAYMRQRIVPIFVLEIICFLFIAYIFSYPTATTCSSYQNIFICSLIYYILHVHVLVIDSKTRLDVSNTFSCFTMEEYCLSLQ